MDKNRIITIFVRFVQLRLPLICYFVRSDLARRKGKNATAQSFVPHVFFSSSRHNTNFSGHGMRTSWGGCLALPLLFLCILYNVTAVQIPQIQSDEIIETKSRAEMEETHRGRLEILHADNLGGKCWLRKNRSSWDLARLSYCIRLLHISSAVTYQLHFNPKQSHSSAARLDLL